MTTVWTTCRLCGGLKVPIGYVGDVVGLVCMCRFEWPSGMRISDELSRIIADQEREKLRSEVERLRAANQYLDDLVTQSRASIKKLSAEVERLRADAERYRWLASSCRSTGEHWGGRWSIVIDGPAPKSHGSEDDFDAAVDAARAAQEGKT